jgi:hypothetical protein
MPETRSLLERVMERVQLRPFTLEGFHDRRDRKRRNQRITAGVVGIAVFVAAIWIVTSGLSLDRSEKSVAPAGDVTGPAETGPAETGPAETGPAEVPNVPSGNHRGFGWYDGGDPEYDLPPEDAVPSTPEEGELVAQFNGYPGRFVYVYADGRVISWGRGTGHLAFGERRLTPEGVELVRSGALQPGAFIRPAYEVPLDVWENPDVKPFVPSRYAVCYYMDSGDRNLGKMGGYEQPSRVVGFFPAPARAILRGEMSFVAEGDGDSAPLECSEVTTDEARALVDILGVRRVEDLEGDRIITEITMMLPHGIRIYCTHCG